MLGLRRQWPRPSICLVCLWSVKVAVTSKSDLLQYHENEMPACEVLSHPWGAHMLLRSQSQRLRPRRLRPDAVPTPCLVLVGPDSVTVYVTSFFCARETPADIHRCGQRGVRGCDIEGRSHQAWVPAAQCLPEATWARWAGRWPREGGAVGAGGGEAVGPLPQPGSGLTEVSAAQPRVRPRTEQVERH